MGNGQIKGASRALSSSKGRPPTVLTQGRLQDFVAPVAKGTVVLLGMHSGFEPTHTSKCRRSCCKLQNHQPIHMKKQHALARLTHKASHTVLIIERHSNLAWVLEYSPENDNLLWQRELCCHVEANISWRCLSIHIYHCTHCSQQLSCGTNFGVAEQWILKWVCAHNGRIPSQGRRKLCSFHKNRYNWKDSYLETRASLRKTNMFLLIPGSRFQLLSWNHVWISDGP